MRHAQEAYVAVLFHDAVYDVRRTDNEARSAALARDEAPRWFDVDLDRVEELILLTASHGRQAVIAPDAALFLDCHMAILGSSPQRYQLYTQQITAEWEPKVSPADFRRGRSEFIRRLMQIRIFIRDNWYIRI